MEETAIIGKKWYKSKTVWANIIAVGVMVVQSQFGFTVTAEESGAVLVVINLLCRAFVKEPLIA